MAKDKKVVSDLGSQLVEEMRLQLNRLTTMVEAMKDAADSEATGDDFRTAVAALTGEEDFESILTRPTMPPAPKLEE